MQALLVTVQRVCKDWSTAIASSAKLQQALFLLPITDDVLHWSWPYALDTPESSAVYENAPEQCIFQHPPIQPHLADSQQYPDIIYRAEPPGRPRTRHGEKPNVLHWPNILYRGEASWRRQLATQPPVKKLTHFIDAWDGQDPDHVEAAGAMLTLGDIADEFGTLDIGMVEGGHCWQEISWCRGSTYKTIARAKKASYALPWCVESSIEAGEHQETIMTEENQDQGTEGMNDGTNSD